MMACMNPLVVIIAVVLAGAGAVLLVRARAIASFMEREHPGESGSLGISGLSPQSPLLYRILGVVSILFGLAALLVPVPA